MERSNEATLFRSLLLKGNREGVFAERVWGGDFVVVLYFPRMKQPSTSILGEKSQ